MNSIDRKLARCAREIEAAKPKGMSFTEFETGVHWPKGWTAEATEPEATTPSQPKAAAAPFKVGDRVVAIKEGNPKFGCRGTVRMIASGPTPIMVRHDGDDAADDQENWACWMPTSLRNLTAQKEEAKPSAGEWIEWKGGKCPVDQQATVEYRMRFGGTYKEPAGNLDWKNHSEETDIVAYRVLP